MDEDPILRGRATGVPESSLLSDPYTNGLYIVNLNNSEIERLGVFMQDFYDRLNQGVTRNAFTMFKGAVFAVGTKELGNLEWKEHCATSLREVFHVWKTRNKSGFASDFCQHYKSGKALTNDESDTFTDFWDRYQYFSGVDHHEAAKIMGTLKKIRKDYTLKFEDCFSEETFLEEVQNYFKLVSKIVSYCSSSPYAT